MRPLGSSRQTLLSLQYLGFSCTTSFFSQVEHKRLCGHPFLGVSSDSTLSCVISGTFLNISEPQFPSRWNEGHSIYMSNYKGGLNESVWLSEVSKVKLLPSSLAPTSSPFPLPSPPGSLGLLSYALSISCASPETRLYSLFICKPFM